MFKDLFGSMPCLTLPILKSTLKCIIFIFVIVQVTEHLTEESNGFMTANSLTKRINFLLGTNISSKTLAKYRHTYLSKYFVTYYFCIDSIPLL